MKRFYSYFLILAFSPFLLFFSYPGGSPGGRTGSLGDGGSTCTGCHTGSAVIDKTGWITTNIPAEGYTPGETYTITATGTHEGVSKFGFELTAEDNIGTKRGTLTITDAGRTRFTNSDKAVTHTADGIAPDGNTNSWSMEWTAPAASFGEIYFYSAFNAANGDGGASGDQIYTSNITVLEKTTGIGDDLLAESVHIYPNPATRFVNIDTPKGSEIRIVDMLGHELVRKGITDENEKLDVSRFDDGIYFIHVIHEGNAATMRFMKN